ncbi:MAG: FHA domain-containing protein [Phycisphaerales bacterium]|nr:FHA domain-containing protein [Phycisphaerales bacterium]
MTAILIAKADGELVLRVELDPRTKLTIGRSPRCDLVLSAASISRHHALLFEHGGVWRMVDTGSRTGVHGPDGPVRQAELDPDLWCRIGPAYLWLVDPKPPEPSAPPNATAGAPPVALRGELIERWQRGAFPSVGGTDGDDLPGPRLMVMDEDYRPLRRISLRHRDRLTIGSNAVCDLVVDEPGLAALHCVLFREGRHWTVADTGAVGGLRVDGRAFDRRRLRPCMPVHLGTKRLLLDPVAFVDREDEDEPMPPLAEAVSAAGIEPMTAAVSMFLDPEEPGSGATGQAASGRIREPAWPADAPAR